MRKFSLLMMLLFSLGACELVNDDVSQYDHDPKKRSVLIDDHRIYVVPTATHAYVAWGGAEDRDGFIQYRQKRAVELISGCHVSKITSKKTDTVLHATVKC